VISNFTPALGYRALQKEARRFETEGHEGRREMGSKRERNKVRVSGSQRYRRHLACATRTGDAPWRNMTTREPRYPATGFGG
jgi:hypothetical protein